MTDDPMFTWQGSSKLGAQQLPRAVRTSRLSVVHKMTGRSSFAWQGSDQHGCPISRVVHGMVGDPSFAWQGSNEPGATPIGWLACTLSLT